MTKEWVWLCSKKLYKTARFGPGLWFGNPALRGTWLAPEDTTAAAALSTGCYFSLSLPA